MTGVYKITIQLRAPRGTFPGEIVSSYYCVADQDVVLCDEDGKPTGGKRHLSPGDDPRLIACVLLRERSRSKAPRGWNEPLRYPRIY
jgi:hypothetical protein